MIRFVHLALAASLFLAALVASEAAVDGQGACSTVGEAAGGHAQTPASTQPDAPVDAC